MIEKAFPDILAVDPTGCGCTECIIGEYVQYDIWEKKATAADVAAFLTGDVRNNTYDSTLEIILRSWFDEESANEFVRRFKEDLDRNLSSYYIDDILEGC